MNPTVAVWLLSLFTKRNVGFDSDTSCDTKLRRRSPENMLPGDDRVVFTNGLKT